MKNEFFLAKCPFDTVLSDKNISKYVSLTIRCQIAILKTYTKVFPFSVHRTAMTDRGLQGGLDIAELTEIH